jgi:hypothetical protein
LHSKKKEAIPCELANEIEGGLPRRCAPRNDTKKTCNGGEKPRKTTKRPYGILFRRTISFEDGQLRRRRLVPLGL